MSAKFLPIALLAAVMTFMVPNSAQANPVFGKGTWETTLLGRDANGNPIDSSDSRTVMFYDTVLDITWMRTVDETARGITGPLSWHDTWSWLGNLNDVKAYGFNDWRLPSMVDTYSSPKTQADGCNYSNAGGTDCGFNVQTATSEMAHLYYLTLGNVAYCDPATSTINTCNGPQAGFGLPNTGYFQNIPSYGLSFWSGLQDETDRVPSAWYFDFGEGYQHTAGIREEFHVFAVRTGDVYAAVEPPNQVPEPPSLPLTAMALVVGLLMLSRSEEGERIRSEESPARS